METKDRFEYHEQWKNPKTGRMIGHVYTLNDKPLKGVTSVLKVIAKDNLIQWSADEAVSVLGWKNPKKFNQGEIDEYFKTFWDKFTKMTPADFWKVLTEARVAYIGKRDKGADIGTIAHKMVEMYADKRIAVDKLITAKKELEAAGGTMEGGKITFPKITVEEALRKVNEEDDKPVKLTEQEQLDTEAMYNEFVKWAEDPLEEVEFLFSERKMYSKEHWIAGTCDLGIRWHGKKMIADVKTMDTMWDRTPFFQANGGYRLMLEEAGEKDFDGCLILCLPKPEKIRAAASTKYPIKPFSLFESYDSETDKKGFLAALHLQEALDTYQK